jgi:hypothetical protein
VFPAVAARYTWFAGRCAVPALSAISATVKSIPFYLSGTVCSASKHRPDTLTLPIYILWNQNTQSTESYGILGFIL